MVLNQNKQKFDVRHIMTPAILRAATPITTAKIFVLGIVAPMRKEAAP
jgi:hypothetical protein